MPRAPRVRHHQVDRGHPEAEWLDGIWRSRKFIAIAKRQVRLVFAAGNEETHPALCISKGHAQAVNDLLAGGICYGHIGLLIRSEACRCVEVQIERRKRKMSSRIFDRCTKTAELAPRLSAVGYADMQQLDRSWCDGRMTLPAKTPLPVGDARQIAFSGIHREEDRPQVGNQVGAEHLRLQRLREQFVHAVGYMFRRYSPPTS